MGRWAAAWSLLLMTVANPSVAAEDDRAAELFEQGRAAQLAGNIEQACALFSASLAVDRRVGTLLNVADCEERRAQLVRALGLWREGHALAVQRGDQRATFAKQRLDRLDARLPRLTLRLAHDAPPDTVVWIEAPGSERALLQPGAYGTPLAVNPGTTRVTVSVPGRADRSLELTLAEGEREDTILTTGSRTVAPPPPTRAAPAVAEEATNPTLRTVGFIVGGVGLAGLGVGAALGLAALDKQSDAEPHCDEDNLCDQEGVDLRAAGIEAATGSTVAFALGAAALATGVILVFVPTSESAGVAIAPGSVALRW